VASAREVLRHPDLRAVELGWALGVGADWMLTVVGLLVAWEAGGAIAVGLFGLVRMVPAIVNLLVDAMLVAGACAGRRRVVRVARGRGRSRGCRRALAARAISLAAVGALVRPTPRHPVGDRERA
jgi:hypothetical protein